MSAAIHTILKQYWGYDHFRPMQEDIIHSVLEGHDTLALLPTGGGKSICFQVPAMSREGICLVISPLIALIKDQVENLRQKGIGALAIYSGMSYGEIRQTLQNAIHGNYKFLYVSPERLETRLFREYLPALQINLLAVDEAHCISQWGYDFRPTYTRIAAIREELPGVPVLALTASATKRVQEDIAEKLLFGASQRHFMQSFERANLSYSVFDVPAKQTKLLEILKNVPGTGIVYCKSRRHTREVADLLRMHGFSADYYHAGLGNDDRHRKQEEWIANKTRIMVCTNAFGMGIDKPDVRVVVHYDMPDCLENYYQEAGRAGRDGKRAYAVLLYQPRESENLLQQTDIRYPHPEKIKEIYTALMNYLQVPAGSGEGQYYPVDLAAFGSAFNLNSLTVTYGLKILEQEGLISFSESFFKPAVVVFTCTRDSLFDFEAQHPEWEPLLKGLLRSYEGIFDFPASISESRLARFINSDPETVKNGLRQLQEFGLIRYEPQKEGPQVFILQNRMYTDSFRINTAEYLARKKNFETRVAAIIDYAGAAKPCRSKLIARYFGADNFLQCGICDNCIRNKKLPVTAADFSLVREQLIRLSRERPAGITELLEACTSVKKEKVWEVINYLVAEKRLTIDEKGLIKWND